jgi:hypothetical protein
MLFDFHLFCVVCTKGVLNVPRSVLADSTRFVNLQLYQSGALLDRNVYWLSRESQQDVFNYSNHRSIFPTFAVH